MAISCSFIVCCVVLTAISLIFFPVISHLYANLCRCPTPTIKRAPSVPSTSASEQPSQTEKSTTSDLRGFFKRTTLTATTFFFLCALLINIDRICSPMIKSPAILTICSAFCYCVARMVLSLIFIGRLYYTFKDSVLDKYSQHTFVILAIMWLFMPTLMTAGLIAGRVTDNVLLTLPFFVLFFVVDNVLSVVLMIMYMKKLKILVTGTRAPWLIQLMVKYTVLYAFCFASSVLVLLLTVTVALSDLGAESEENRRLSFAMMSVDSLCNTMGIWLNLRFANHRYQKLCACCHAKMASCFGYSTDEVMASRTIAASNRTVKVEMEIQ